MGESKPNKIMEDFAIFNLTRKKARKAKMNQQVNVLVGQMAEMKLDNDFNPMNTFNLADGSVILENEDGNEYTTFTTRSIKKK